MPAQTDAPFHLLNADVDACVPLQQGVVAIGNFDGVHLGHRNVLRLARSLAADHQCPAYALSFEPHPRTVFSPHDPVFRLTPPHAKARVLEAFGLDGLVNVPFDKAFAALSAEHFVEEVLVRRLQVRHVIIGFDFHFGHNREGTPAYLMDCGKRLGFGVTIVDALTDAGDPVSSSRVRERLQGGDVTGAAALLGYHYFISGEVIHGEKRGRDLGFPTANIRLDEDNRLAMGIYAVRVSFEGQTHDAVASYGRRPTFDNGAPLLEVCLFDFSGSLYGKVLNVAFHAYLRGEEKFDSLDALVAQMNDDAAKARAILEKTEPVTTLDARL